MELNADRDLAWDSFVSGEAIEFPYVTQYVSYRLKPQIDENAVLATLKRDSAVLSSEVTLQPTQIIPSWQRPANRDLPDCSSEFANSEWPFGEFSKLHLMPPRATALVPWADTNS